MKRVNRKKIATALAILSLPLLTSCGGSNNPPPGAGGVGGINNGLLGPGGCMPINTPQIGFQGQNVQFGIYNIRAGRVPYVGDFGQVVIGAGGMGGPYQRTGSDGTLSINVQQTPQMNPQYPNTGYPNTGYPSTTTGFNGPVNITGYLSINQLVQNDIIRQFGGYSGLNAPLPNYPNTGYPNTGYPNTGYPNTGYPNGQMQLPCVSSIAIDVGNYHGMLYGGKVYLYLNNTQHGYTMFF